MAQLFADAARTTLASGISDTATTLTVALGDAFPVADTGTGSVGGTTDWFKAVLDDGVNIEIVYVRTHTAASETFDNVLRGQDGTTARTWSAGAVVGLRVTADDMAKRPIGPSSSTDNTLPRFDGATGKALQGSGVVVGDNDEISGYKGNINAQTGTSYTLTAADTGKVVELTNAAAITLDIPNSLPVGWCCTVVQGGSGAVTFTPASGATLRNRQSHTKTAGQWAVCMLYVRTNSGGSAAEYVLGGDTAA